MHKPIHKILFFLHKKDDVDAPTTIYEILWLLNLDDFIWVCVMNIHMLYEYLSNTLHSK